MSVAEMIISGELCGGCGCYIKGDSQGYVRYCKSCQPRPLQKPKGKPTPKKTKCPTCGAKVKEVGLNDHIRVKHGVIA